MSEGLTDTTHSIAVLLPCYNEEGAIGQVVQDFRRMLPTATIYVYDNNSSDGTRQEAAEAGAVVRTEPLQGKGNVVRRMFADIEADIYVMADGDATYDPKYAPHMIRRLIDENLDMVVGARVPAEDEAYPRGHQWGNRMFNRLVAFLFGRGLSDIFSGYRIFSRRFAKSFPALSGGFEVETELSVHALDLRMPVAEEPFVYASRAEGTESKLRTLPDGFAILMTIMMLLKEVRPFLFFGGVAAVLVLASLGLGYPVIMHWLETGLVPRVPTAILSTGLMILAFISLTCGLILDSLARTRRETKRMRYLTMRSIS